LDISQVKQLVQAAFPDCEVTVDGGDGKYLITAVGSAFEGLNAVKRQQAVYVVINEHIASGAIHAVTMRLLTPAEFDASQAS